MRRPIHTHPGIKRIVTCFASIAVILAVAFVVWPGTVNSQSGDVENPQGESLGLSGVVPGEPPTQAPSINSPVDGQVFTEIPITVSGTCQAGHIIEVYKNDVFAGSALCRGNNTFTVDIGLFFGENVLFTRARDALGQTGPKSDSVTVIYDPPVTESDRQLGQQLLLESNVSFRGASPGEEITFPVRLSGGKGPYAISVNWGDGNNDVISRLDTGDFKISRVYEQSGVYRIVLQATDDNDQTAFLQIVAAIGGEVGGGIEDKEPPTRVERVYVLWPLYVLMAIIPLSFWLGVRHDKRRHR